MLMKKISRHWLHSIFGSGTVVDVDLIKAAHLVKFDNIDTPRSISFRAKLEKV